MKRASVRLRWGPGDELDVGTLVEAERGRVFFEYAADFLATGWELSPLKLPARAELIEHTDRKFGPLFGAFDDSLPDGWGLLLMDRHFRQQRRDPATVSAIERLLFLGSGTMGALTYHPSAEPSAPTTLDLVQLAQQATDVLQGADVEVLPELLRAGGSPGGARPKVLVGVHDDEIMSGVDDLPEGWEHWLVKLSSRRSAPGFPTQPAGWDDGPLEHAYMRMAELAGLIVPPHRLFAEGRYFGVRRFDRAPDNRRHHMHSLGGLLHSDHRIPSCDYDLLFRVIRRLTHDQRAVIEGIRRMVFNVAAHNRDDHVKNFAFLMDYAGNWAMSPTYDLSYAPGPGGEHTMTIDGEAREPTGQGMIALAERHGVDRAQTRSIIDQVNDAVARWREIAKGSGCDRAKVAAAAKGHRIL